MASIRLFYAARLEQHPRIRPYDPITTMETLETPPPIFINLVPPDTADPSPRWPQVDIVLEAWDNLRATIENNRDRIRNRWAELSPSERVTILRQAWLNPTSTAEEQARWPGQMPSRHQPFLDHVVDWRSWRDWTDYERVYGETLDPWPLSSM